MTDAETDPNDAAVPNEHATHLDAYQSSETASMSEAALDGSQSASDDALVALKLRVEWQTAELNAKDLVLTRKQERIDELSALLQQLRVDGDAFDGSLSPMPASSSESIHSLRAEIQRLNEQVRRDEDEFAMASAALNAKEHALADALSELDRARDCEAQLRLQLKEQLRPRSAASAASSSASGQSSAKPSRTAKPTVEYADACLSPRSFRESALIALRDDAIAAKTREVWLLTGRNDELRAQLDELEGALERVQTALMRREHDAVRSQRAIDALQAEVEALRTLRGQAEGRERAMAIATAQNAKLLQALAAQERHAEEVAEKLSEAERENEHLRTRVDAQIAALATSASAAENSELVAAMRKELAALHDKLQRERKRERAELAELRLKQQLSVERLESELVARRTRQYELTRELQDAQSELHEAMDARETAVERLEACEARMRELESLLSESLVRSGALERQLSESVAARSELEVQARTRQVDAEKELAALKTQLTELNEALRAALRRDKTRERELLERGDAVKRLESECRELRERVARLADQVTREAQQRAGLTLETQALTGQLDEVRRQFERAMDESAETKRQLDAHAAQARHQSRDLQRELEQALDGKSALITRIADAVRAAFDSGKATKDLAGALTSLALDGCALEDRDAAPLLSTLASLAPATLRHLDLRSNRLTASSARAIATFAQHTVATRKRVVGTDGGVCEVDLRCNFISLDGVREVATGLEAVAALSSVIVTNSGRIECFADKEQNQHGFSDRPAVTPVLAIDMSANLDVEEMVSVARKLQASHRHRQRLDGPTARGSTSSNNSTMSLSASALQKIYGADLVGAAFGSPAPKSNGRRKSSSIEVPAPSASPRPALPTPTATSARSSPQLPLVPTADRSTPREEDEDDADLARLAWLSASTPSLPRLTGR